DDNTHENHGTTPGGTRGGASRDTRRGKAAGLPGADAAEREAHAATVRRLEQSSGKLAAAAIARMDQQLPWYRAMPPENRSWIGLVAQAGIAAFTEWFRHPDAPQAISTDVFGTAPRELTRAITLRQ